MNPPFQSMSFIADHFSCLKKYNTIGSLAKGGHGNPVSSGFDAHELRVPMTSFKALSNDLCKNTAELARRKENSYLSFPLPPNTCRLIVLDKCANVRPLEVGRALGLIIGTIFIAHGSPLALSVTGFALIPLIKILDG